MKECLEKSQQNLEINCSISSSIVGSFYVKKHHYFVIILEDSTKQFTDFDLSCLPIYFQGLEVGQFEAHGQHFAIVEAENYQSNIKSNIADMLTERELQIVKLVAQGDANKQIASKLHISEWTVSTHIRRVFAKLGVDSRAAMVYQCAFFL